MRTITLLVIACCFAAALSLPKHHTNHVAKKIVHEVEEDLDVDEDLLKDQEEFEESRSVADDDNEALEEDDDQALEEDDNEAFENDNEALEEESAEADDDDENKLEEDSDNEVPQTQLEEDDEEDEENKLEEEEEEEAVAKVEDDISSLKRSLEESDLSAHLRKEASANLNMIGKDVREFISASESRKAALKEAIQDRMKAFHLMIGDKAEHAPEHHAKVSAKHSKVLEEEDAVSRVESDVKELEESIESSKMTKAQKHEARDNLESIKRDAEEYSHAKSSHAKDLFRQAIQKRMQAMHLMLEADEPHHQISSTAVLSDVEHIESALKTSHLSSKAKKAVRDNLNHIAKDAKELESASEGRRERLSSALKLRAKALKQQLEEDN